MLTAEEHRERHKMLHKHLDELLADWLEHGGGIEHNEEGKFGTQKPISDLAAWSHEQTICPTHPTKRKQ